MYRQYWASDNRKLFYENTNLRLRIEINSSNIITVSHFLYPADNTDDIILCSSCLHQYFSLKLNVAKMAIAAGKLYTVASCTQEFNLTCGLFNAMVIYRHVWKVLLVCLVRALSCTRLFWKITVRTFNNESQQHFHRSSRLSNVNWKNTGIPNRAGLLESIRYPDESIRLVKHLGLLSK